MLKTLAAAACLTLTSLAVAAAPALADTLTTSVDPAKLAKKKRTTLGLYLTSKEAYAALEKDPSIVFIDVRSRAEFSFVGHPTVVDRNIPFRKLAESYEIDTKRKQYKMVPNVDFPRAVELLLDAEGKTKNDTIFVMCRSGARSKGAADYLAKVGYTKVYNVVDGFEGDKNKDTGHRTVNGWKNSDLPWTFALSEKQAYDDPSM